MKVAIFSTQSYDRLYLDRYKEGSQLELTYFDAALDEHTAGLTQGFEAVCIFVNDRVDLETANIISANGVRAVVLRCAGFNNVDVAAAHERGVKVLRVPAYSPQAVAEHTVALILTLNRKTHKAYNRVREHNFSLERMMGFNLYGKTVGVIGTGQIGAAFCRIMLGFGCTVIAYDPLPSPALKVQGVTYVPLEELLRTSDIISLHCPLTPATHHLINKEGFDMMKNGVMLINTSRGAVIQTRDAVQALKSEKLGYLGIDVYEQEENLFFRDLSERIVPDDLIARLMAFPNVLITAHQGFFTKEALQQIAVTTIKNLNDVALGTTSQNEILPESKVYR
ncbi:2-hydroxyacid dehydrogenase [Pontibacter mangrovi]|uniref:2-hydroxyacid dehydrogenase n=1 Tax=Pontibacter mangrovi TaxID=2589816 RepID=A0A501W576_9BACT|nr:2-hydroxyacid dehydrogenase [Pontibacter mangrovi]TPE42391.1 2-hydroxyacid dehydrogenase [Pontibacter mangrovi]